MKIDCLGKLDEVKQGNCTKGPYRVCMFVYNAFRPDIRVLKEAVTLTNAGYEVSVLAVQQKNSIPHEEYSGVMVRRIERKPFHFRLISLWKIVVNSRLKLGLLFAFILLEASIHFDLYAIFLEYRYLLYMFLFLFFIVSKKVISFGTTVLRSFHQMFSYLDYYKKCYQFLSNNPVDIYHAHDLNTLAIAWWCKTRLGGNLVYDSHELFTETSMLSKIDKVLWTKSEGYLIKKSDHVITVCDCIAEELRERYKIALPTVIMNCPNSPGRLLDRQNLIREAAGIERDIPIILYQGGFANNRGLRKLLLSSGYFEQGKLVMMGWGNIENELREFVVNNNLEGKVYFIPPAPQIDLLNWSATADIGVIPYRAVGLNNYYTCPNKLFEYINSGLPVAGSAFPEIKKILNTWGLGSTFDPENSESIARVINTMLRNKEKLGEMRENAIKAAKVLNWQCESIKLLDVYSRLEPAREKKHV
jgi:glycosyltransferase involved in cell wall biosynthesis